MDGAVREAELVSSKSPRLIMTLALCYAHHIRPTVFQSKGWTFERNLMSSSAFSHKCFR